MPESLRDCVVPRDKVVRYLLDPQSIDGSGKAKFFTAFGFDPASPDVLIDALRRHAITNPTVETYTDRWGTHFNVIGPLVCPNGRSPTVLTGWIEDGNGPPRLVTAFPA